MPFLVGLQVRAKVMIDGKLNPNIVGQSVQKLAELFGIKVPAGTKVIIGEVSEIGKHEPLSEEKLCPVLAMYRSPSFEDAVDKADRLIRLFGPGHTSVLYTNPLNKNNIDHFSQVVKTVRVLINTPASQVRDLKACCVGDGCADVCLPYHALLFNNFLASVHAVVLSCLDDITSSCPVVSHAVLLHALHEYFGWRMHCSHQERYSDTASLAQHVQGAIGDLYNFHLDPSLTLGCGTWGSTSVSTNVGPMQLLNIKSVTERRENMLWFRVPPKVGCWITISFSL